MQTNNCNSEEYFYFEDVQTLSILYSIGSGSATSFEPNNNK